MQQHDNGYIFLYTIYLIYLTHWHEQRRLSQLIQVVTTFQPIYIFIMSSDDFPNLLIFLPWVATTLSTYVNPFISQKSNIYIVPNKTCKMPNNSHTIK